MNWGNASPFSIGVEEELFLVDAGTLDTAPVFAQAVPEPNARLKPELFACLVETTTPICRGPEEALAELERLRIDVRGRAGKAGATVIATGTHPLARGEGQPLVALPRYERLREELGDGLYTQLVCGLHVHVALPDADTALRTF